MKNKITLIVAIIVVGILAYVKIVFLNNSEANSPKKKAENSPISVNGYIVKKEFINEKVSTSGTLLANKELTLLPEIAGKIITLNMKEGSTVNEGALLVKINDADLKAQLKKLKLQEKLSTETELRHKKLLEAGGMSQEQYDATVTQLQTIKAEIEYVQTQIAKTEIKAPFTGKIGLLNIYEGSYVTPTSVLATIQQVSQLKLDFSLPEKYASHLKIGQPFTFTVDGDTTDYTAQITAFEPKIDISTRSLLIRATTDNRKGKLFPGSYAKILFPMSENTPSLMAPTQSVIAILKGQKVFVNKNGSAKETIIKTGLRFEKSIQITEGLQEGDTVITTGIMQLKPNMPVKITIDKK